LQGPTRCVLAAAVGVTGTATAGTILVMINMRSGLACRHAVRQLRGRTRDRRDQQPGGTRYVVVAALAVTAIDLLRDRPWTTPALSHDERLTVRRWNDIERIVDRTRPPSGR